MKKTAKYVLLIGLSVLFLLCAGYFLLAFYYRDGFSLNTWINGVYCTGKTVEEVNSELLYDAKAPIVIMKDKDGKCVSLDMSEAGYQEDYLKPLQSFLERQNPLLWVDNVLSMRSHRLSPDITYNDEQLRDLFEQTELVRAEQSRRMDFGLEFSEADGYFLYDGLSDRLDVEKAFLVLQSSLSEEDYEIDLLETDCYYSVPLNKEQQAAGALALQVEDFQKCNIVYDMGAEQLPLDASVMSGFLKKEGNKIRTDENGCLMLDEEAVAAFVASLAADYDTYQKEREFHSTKGDIVTVKGVTYGTLLDQRAEVSYLMDTLLTAQAHTEEAHYHIPSYKREGVVRGLDDIGDTYIEVDMTAQKLYYYEQGELKLETAVVTGNARRGWDTPEGVNYVYKKQKNRVLRGANYATPVKYWMPVNGNIGIHDADWRSEFGGEIYKTNGSHGCINTPPEKMAELYEMVEVGTPVVLFY